MPEYLTPGVYLEETSFRSRSIEGVPTSTFGMAGLTRYGPVPYQLDTPTVTMVHKPTLVTSFTEFERAFGSLEDVGTGNDTRNYLAYAAQVVLRQRRPPALRVPGLPVHQDTTAPSSRTTDFAKLDTRAAPAVATWRARWPGLAGQTISVKVTFQRSKNILGTVNGTATLRGVQPGAAVELVDDRTQIPKDTTAPSRPNLRQVGPPRQRPGLRRPGYRPGGGDPGQRRRRAPCHLTLDVTVRWATSAWTPIPGSSWTLAACRSRRRTRVHLPGAAGGTAGRRSQPGLAARGDPGRGSPAAVGGEPARRAARPGRPTYLTGGGDGGALSTDGRDAPAGRGGRRRTTPTIAATGLAALGEIDDIAIVAMPDSVRLRDRSRAEGRRRLPDRRTASSCVTGSPSSTRRSDSSISRVREFRSQFDTKYGALYYPWVRDPRPDRRRTTPARRRPRCSCRRPASRPGSTRAATSSAACTRRRPTRSCSGITRFDAERHLRPAVGAEPRGHQRAALLPGPQQPGLGRAHDELGPGVEVRQRPPAVHLPGALDRQEHAVGGVRAEQRAALGQHPADHRATSCWPRGAPAR